MTYEYLLQYLNESVDGVPGANLQKAINEFGAKGYRLLFNPERIPVLDQNNEQKSDKSGNNIWAWKCWFERELYEPLPAAVYEPLPAAVKP